MRKLELLLNALLLLPMIAGIGLILLSIVPINLVIVGVCYAAGIADLAFAKLPQINRGIYFSFGPCLVPAERRHAYAQAYKWIALGLALQCIVLLMV